MATNFKFNYFIFFKTKAKDLRKQVLFNNALVELGNHWSPGKVTWANPMFSKVKLGYTYTIVLLGLQAGNEAKGGLGVT